MKHWRRMLLNGLTASSLLLALSTIWLWVASARHPWMVCINYDSVRPVVGHNWEVGEGWWQIVAGQHGPLGISGFGWDIEGDPYELDIEELRPDIDGYSWDNGWWKFVLLWLALPVWRAARWKSISSTPVIQGVN
jgi:hypothetical protein